MKRLMALIALVFIAASPASAEETRLVIRALTQDAKFIGTGMSGMQVIIEDADTGEILDQGVTSGTTGNSERILFTPKARYDRLSDETSAAYVSTLDLEAPRRIRVTVRGPMAQPQVGAEASSVRWVLPGRHVESGDGWLLIVPGFAVDVLSPGAHSYVDGSVDQIRVRANVVMICGCPTMPGGTWDASEIEITAAVRRNGEAVATLPMRYAGETSQYEVDVPVNAKGTYEVLVSAFDPRTGNSGVDRTSFILR